MGYRSETVNIVRYTNGTLVKITASADGFVSYDYNPDTNVGTFSPSSITLTVTYGGDLHFGKWEYSTDGEEWTELSNGEHGIALNSNLLTVPASSDLFGTTNTQVVFRCVGDNPLYNDTATITREVDALQVYRTAKTQINQSNDKIALIASDEQLAYFTKSATFYNRYSNFEQTSQGFMQTVTNSYATKLYADAAADDALDDAKAYADGKFVDQTTYTTKMQQTDAAISTQAGQITGLSTEVGTKARTYMQAAAPTGAAAGDLWVNTSKNNEVSRYNGSAWVGVVNANAVVSQINQTAEQITISAQKIDFNGAISANGNFKITEEGDLEASNAKISGTIDVGGVNDEDGVVRIYDNTGTKKGEINNEGIIFGGNGAATWEYEYENNRYRTAQLKNGTMTFSRSFNRELQDSFEIRCEGDGVATFTANHHEGGVNPPYGFFGFEVRGDDPQRPVDSLYKIFRSQSYTRDTPNRPTHRFDGYMATNRGLLSAAMLQSVTFYPTSGAIDYMNGGYYVVGCAVFICVDFEVYARSYSEYLVADGFPHGRGGVGRSCLRAYYSGNQISTAIMDRSFTISGGGKLYFTNDFYSAQYRHVYLYDWYITDQYSSDPL